MRTGHVRKGQPEQWMSMEGKEGRLKWERYQNVLRSAPRLGSLSKSLSEIIECAILILANLVWTYKQTFKAGLCFRHGLKGECSHYFLLILHT